MNCIKLQIVTWFERKAAYKRKQIFSIWFLTEWRTSNLQIPWPWTHNTTQQLIRNNGVTSLSWITCAEILSRVWVGNQSGSVPGSVCFKYTARIYVQLHVINCKCTILSYDNNVHLDQIALFFSVANILFCEKCTLYISRNLVQFPCLILLILYLNSWFLDQPFHIAIGKQFYFLSVWFQYSDLRYFNLARNLNLIFTVLCLSLIQGSCFQNIWAFPF